MKEYRDSLHNCSLCKNRWILWAMQGNSRKWNRIMVEDCLTFPVKELALFVKVMLLEETPAVLSLGKLCEDHGYTDHWTSGQKPHLTKKGKRINCLQFFKLCAIRSLWFIDEFLYNAYTYIRIWRKQIQRKSSTRKKWKYEWGATEKHGA